MQSRQIGSFWCKGEKLYYFWIPRSRQTCQSYNNEKNWHSNPRIQRLLQLPSRGTHFSWMPRGLPIIIFFEMSVTFIFLFAYEIQISNYVRPNTILLQWFIVSSNKMQKCNLNYVVYHFFQKLSCREIRSTS